MAKDYYKTLEIERSATEKDVKSAYRRLARKYHPDMNPNDKQAEERFKELGEAYEVLGDVDKRRKYDQFGADWEKYDKLGSYGGRSSDYGFDYKRNAGTSTEAGANNAGFSDIFDTIFGSKTKGGTRTTPGAGTSASEFGFSRSTSTRPTRGDDREQAIELSLEEVFNGTTRQLQVQSSDVCQSCNGTGLRSGQRCSTCMGLGVVPRSKRLEVRIPAGVEEGSRVRFAGEGGSGLAGGPRGDLFLKVHILPHPVFERQGADLHTNVPIPLYTALLGGEAIVPSLRGDKLGLAIPADTPNSKIFRLSGQGMPVLNQPGVRGNLFVKVEIVLPNNLSDEEKRLFRHLRELRPQ